MCTFYTTLTSRSWNRALSRLYLHGSPSVGDYGTQFIDSFVSNPHGRRSLPEVGERTWWQNKSWPKNKRIQKNTGWVASGRRQSRWRWRIKGLRREGKLLKCNIVFFNESLMKVNSSTAGAALHMGQFQALVSLSVIYQCNRQWTVNLHQSPVWRRPFSSLFL